MLELWLSFVLESMVLLMLLLLGLMLFVLVWLVWLLVMWHSGNGRADGLYTAAFGGECCSLCFNMYFLVISSFIADGVEYAVEGATLDIIIGILVVVLDIF